MKSFCINIAELLKMNSGLGEGSNFNQTKKKLIIPKYQREFKWEDEKIISLIADIKEKSKFLGIIILDETDRGYEIVDGQQRITTCMLTIAGLYNYYRGHNREQESLIKLLKTDDSFLFSNESTGDFLLEENNSIRISISSEADIYKQSNDFNRAFEVITKSINEIPDSGKAHEFKQKLLDCKIMVLINDIHEFGSPVEQLFLDINEKAQELDVEDVFKGHCFKNFEDEYHEDLKNKWVKFKETAMGYNSLGFKNVSEYIYLYLLEMKDKSMPKDLTVDGRHFLEGKTMDETEQLLDNMINYGKTGLQFCSKIKQIDYKFSDICADSRAHENTDDHITLKRMCKEMLTESGTAIYQKLPFLSFLYYLSNNNKLINQIKHSQLRRIITDLYIYMNLFMISGQRKSKNIIDLTLREAMESDEPLKNVINAAKELRKTKVDEFNMMQNNTGKKLEFICSIIDNYSIDSMWLNMVYGIENKHNIEHLIIMKNKKVQWEDGEIHLILNDFPCDFMNNNIKKATNYLVMDMDLNESLKSKDIVTKIHLIKKWYEERQQDVPKHISIFIDYITHMSEYNDLKNLKGHNPTTELITEKYNQFLQAYFNDDNLTLLNIIKDAFTNSFVQ